jgi:putative flippase GtrA
MMNSLGEKKQVILFFCLIGSIGFAIEYAIIWFCSTMLGSGTISPRLLSFPIAVFVTWKLNRLFTFRQKSPASLKEFAKYIHSNIISQSTNVVLYCLLSLPAFALPLISSLGVSTLIATFINFLLLSRYAFRP